MASFKASSPPPVGKVQSITWALSPQCRNNKSYSPLVSTGEDSTSTLVWLAFCSSTLLKLPNRVFKLITRYSRKLSMGGLVTWLKFCRK